MPLFIGDYHRDTGRLTTLEHGAYLLLIMAYWAEGSPLPDDDADLAAITKADHATWRRLRPRIARFFQIGEGLWRHGRIDAELGKAQRRMTKAQAAAEARWRNRKLPLGDARSMNGASAHGVSEQSSGESSEVCQPQPQPQKGEEDPHESSSHLRRGRARALGGAARAAPPAYANVEWEGPAEFRAAFVAEKGENFTHAWLDGCRLTPDGKVLFVPRDFTRVHLEQEARRLLRDLGVEFVRIEGRP